MDTNCSAETLVPGAAAAAREGKSSVALRPRRFRLSKVKLMQLVSVAVLLGLWKIDQPRDRAA